MILQWEGNLPCKRLMQVGSPGCCMVPRIHKAPLYPIDSGYGSHYFFPAVYKEITSLSKKERALLIKTNLPMHNTCIIDNLNFGPCVRCSFATLGTHTVLQSIKRDRPRIKLIGRKTFTYMLPLSSVC